MPLSSTLFSFHNFLEVRSISKAFPGGVIANKHVTLQIKKKTMHALIGENGAGKTTFMKILMGLHQPDDGQIFVRRKQTRIYTPKDAINKGIMMVPQFSSLIDPYNSVTNLALTKNYSNWLIPQLVDSERALVEMKQKLGFAVDLKSPIELLPYEDRQRIEILRALCCKIDLLILDEPTSMLTPQDSDSLYKALRNLVLERDFSVLYSTHKLDEVFDYADDVTVLREGKVVLSKPVRDVSQSELVRAVTGEELLPSFKKTKSSASKDVLNVRNLYSKNEKGKLVLEDINMSVRKGEIVGLVGSSLSGKFELIETIMGLRKPAKGSVEINKTNTTTASHKAIIKLGTSYVPPAANTVSLVPDFSVAENFILTMYDAEPFSKRLLLDMTTIRTHAENCVREYYVKTKHVDSATKTLSGGNKQKLVIGRELSRKDIKLLVLANPTAGLDLRTTYRIWQRIVDLRCRGVGVLLTSEDLNEIKQLSDKIIVLFEGRLIGPLPASSLTVHNIGLMMLAGELR